MVDAVTAETEGVLWNVVLLMGEMEGMAPVAVLFAELMAVEEVP
jgi:hypothetical protein